MPTEDETPAKSGPDTDAAPVPCSACRGTGKVVSNLGGEPHEVQCPWCDGGGVRLPDHDAQVRWRSDESSPQPASGEAVHHDPGEPDDDPPGDQAA